MRFPVVFRRQKGSVTTDPALGSDVAPTTTPPADNADNIVFARQSNINGWPCHRIALCWNQSLFAYTVTAAGTAPPTVTLTGTTPTKVTIEIDVNDTTGGTALGQAKFQWKLNGTTQQTGQTTAATFVLGTTGLTANFGAGPYTNDNVYTSSATTTSLKFDAYFWEASTQNWYKINDTVLTAKPSQLYFFDTVTVMESAPRAAQFGQPGSPAQTGAMAVMVVPQDNSQINGQFTIALAADLTPVGT